MPTQYAQAITFVWNVYVVSSYNVHVWYAYAITPYVGLRLQSVYDENIAHNVMLYKSQQIQAKLIYLYNVGLHGSISNLASSYYGCSTSLSANYIQVI